LQQIRDYLLSKFNTRKESAKQESESLKKELLLEYGTALTLGEELSESCY
jgi:hypothetical protein